MFLIVLTSNMQGVESITSLTCPNCCLQLNCRLSVHVHWRKLIKQALFFISDTFVLPFFNNFYVFFLFYWVFLQLWSEDIPVRLLNFLDRF